eukprot:s288_g15.t1
MEVTVSGTSKDTLLETSRNTDDTTTHVFFSNNTFTSHFHSTVRQFPQPTSANSAVVGRAVVCRSKVGRSFQSLGIQQNQAKSIFCTASL